MGLEILAATAALSAVGQYKEQKEAAEAQKEAEALQQRIADIKAARERAKAIRETTSAQAMARQQASTAGVSVSSGLEGGTAASTTKLASEIGAQEQIGGLSRQISIFNQEAIDAQTRAAGWQAVGSIGGSIFKMWPGEEK